MFEFVDDFHHIPAYVLFCAKKEVLLPEIFTGASIYPAMQNFMLAARAAGLGTVMSTWYRGCERELRDMVGIPDDWVIASLVTVGYPKGGHGAVKRQPAEMVSCIDKWEVPFTAGDGEARDDT
jgi:nitroreductase